VGKWLPWVLLVLLMAGFGLALLILWWFSNGGLVMM